MNEPRDLAEARALLRGVRILASLDDAHLDQLASKTIWRTASAGEEVVSHLDQGKQVFLVVQGSLRAKLETASGREVPIRLLPTGSHLGEIAALTNTPRSVTVTAETDALLGECPAEVFLDLMQNNSAVAIAVAAHLARTVVSLTDRVFELAALEVRFRVYAELLRLASSGEDTSEGILIRNAPTHQAIAAVVGAQREAITRELGVLTGQGMVQQTKREILIRDVEGLRELVRRRAGYTTESGDNHPNG